MRIGDVVVAWVVLVGLWLWIGLVGVATLAGELWRRVRR